MLKLGRAKKSVIIIAVFAAAVIFTQWYFQPEKVVERTFHRNEEALNQMVEAYLAGDMDALNAEIPGVQSAQYWYGDSGMIEFFVKGRGIAPASSYFGFYYSVDGVPLAFQNAKVTLVESGDGWQWTHGGDNRGYTEKISGNWYYYEASF